MDKNLYNISKIESFFDKLLKNKVSANVFPSQLPSTINKSWTDMVMYDVNINDLEGVGKGIVNVFLYTKPIGTSAKKNVKRMSEMEVMLNDAVENSNDEHYKISRYRTYPDYDQNRNLYVNIVSLILQII